MTESRDIVIEFRPDRVANLLKRMVNQACAEGEEWYSDIGEMPTMFDMNRAINILEEADRGELVVRDDREEVVTT